MTILVGVGGGFPINSVQPFNVSGVDLYEPSDGTSWLKTGTIETDTSLYPEATVTVATSPTANYNIEANTASNQDVTWDGTHLAVVDDTSGQVDKYTDLGVYVSSFSISGEVTSGLGITWDGTHFWVADNSGTTIYKYTQAGSYTGTSFSVAGELANSKFVIWDGTHFWVGNNTNTVYQYNSAGVYTGTSKVVDMLGGSFIVAGEFDPLSNKFYVGMGGNMTHTYDSDWTNPAVVIAATNSMRGVTLQNAVVWQSHIPGGTPRTLSNFARFVGISSAKTDTDTGLPIYTRVK